jgi:hypothetical protein
MTPAFGTSSIPTSRGFTLKGTPSRASAAISENAVADLLEGATGGDDEIHVEIIARASLRARAAA